MVHLGCAGSVVPLPPCGQNICAFVVRTWGTAFSVRLADLDKAVAELEDSGAPLEGDGPLRVVEGDGLPGAGFEDDALAVAVFKAQGVTAGGEQNSHCRVGFRRPVFAVPQEANDTWVRIVVVLKGDEHLVAFLRHEPGTTIRAGDEACHGGPVAFVLAAEPWKTHLDATLMVGIANVDHDSGDDTSYLCHASASLFMSWSVRLRGGQRR